MILSVYHSSHQWHQCHNKYQMMSTTSIKWWANHSVHMHCNLSPYHCDTADNASPKIRHIILMQGEWWWSRVSVCCFSSKGKLWDVVTFILGHSCSSHRKLSFYTLELKGYMKTHVIIVWWDYDQRSFTMGFSSKNFDTSLNVMSLRWHCIGNKSVFLMEGAKKAWLRSKTHISPVCRLLYATVASKVVIFLSLDLLS